MLAPVAEPQVTGHGITNETVDYRPGARPANAAQLRSEQTAAMRARLTAFCIQDTGGLGRWEGLDCVTMWPRVWPARPP
jgi:hypothetical protein